MAVGECYPFSVVQRLRNVDKNWNYLCRFGNDQELLDMLKYVNAAEHNISLVSWRLNKKQLYSSVMEIVRHRNLYSPSIWAWSFIHQDIKTMKEYFEFFHLSAVAGPYFQSSFFSYDSKCTESYIHREYGNYFSSSLRIDAIHPFYFSLFEK